MSSSPSLLRTPLYALHLEYGAKMVPFAGWEMPLHYPTGVLGEHQHTRTQAGLFDVSHMGQAALIGPSEGDVARALEKLCPADFLSLAPGRQRYTQFLTQEAGMIDDLMVTRPLRQEGGEARFWLVVNAGCTQKDYDFLRAHLPPSVRLEPMPQKALFALQGPKAAAVLARLAPQIEEMRFMDARSLTLEGIHVHISRTGYTGEDGFEISVSGQEAEPLARLLLHASEVKWIGLAARDSLRLEAGLCLYGQDIDESVNPLEADLGWSIQKRRRLEGGFPGAERLLPQFEKGPPRKRVGLRLLEDRAVARAHTPVFTPEGQQIGEVTSGGFGPTCQRGVAMALIETAYAAPNQALQVQIRGRLLEAQVVPLPFVPHRYVK